jgi:hypothetical protein
LNASINTESFLTIFQERFFMEKKSFLVNLSKKLAQIAKEMDGAGQAQIADQLDEVLESVSLEATAAPEVEIKENTNAQQPVVSKTEAKLSKRQKHSLRNFYRAASKMIDNVSVGRKEFPERNFRKAMSTITAAIDDGLDLLEQFGDVVSKQDVLNRHASTDAVVKTADTDSDLKLYAALKKHMSTEDIVKAGILSEAEASDLEGICPDCGNDKEGGKCEVCQCQHKKQQGKGTEHVEPIRRSMGY